MTEMQFCDNLDSYLSKGRFDFCWCTFCISICIETPSVKVHVFNNVFYFTFVKLVTYLLPFLVCVLYISTSIWVLHTPNYGWNIVGYLLQRVSTLPSMPPALASKSIRHQSLLINPLQYILSVYIVRYPCLF